MHFLGILCVGSLLLVARCTAANSPSRGVVRAVRKSSVPGVDLLNPTAAGFLPVDVSNEAKMFYVFFEARKPAGPVGTLPIILWLQVRWVQTCAGWKFHLTG